MNSTNGDKTMALEHRSLGLIRGALSDDIKTVQYRNIKYADIPDRWQKPRIARSKLSPVEYDGTVHGPICPQPAGGWDYDMKLYGDVKLPYEPSYSSEYECLNAVVTTPSTASRTSALPVMIWVHGGGFAIGSSSWPQYDLQKFVSRSVDIGHPIIGISFNYRLGILGFFASDELGTEGNLGFLDQACAFEWVKLHIEEFGGDPANITVVGESAGATSKQPAFDRAIVMSGDASLRNPRTPAKQHELYWQNVQALGLAELSVTDRIHKMRVTPIEDLLAKLPFAQYFTATTGGEFLPEKVDLLRLSDESSRYGKPSWCTEVVFGSTLHDASLFKDRIQRHPALLDTVLRAIDQTIPEGDRDSVKDAYHLQQNTSNSTLVDSIVQLISDIGFYLPTKELAQAYETGGSTSCHTYHFNQLNPFPGKYTGTASHELDVAYLLQNFNGVFSTMDADFAKAVADIWIRFINGLGWPSGNSKVDTLVLGPEGSLEVELVENYDKNHYGVAGWPFKGVQWEACLRLREAILLGV
ncbi:uncharacterized protein BP5553_01745 [Venustampulla echinocandica]|uniref:Carboxylic ester hydrolase n=1 Tax=Venustampulla echinocandica TaxID=2656787 RepID=A0A370U1W4_9HELO|nr:uncharacterized protein BP5553_01745 [Venustampulla echinocandica]RDL41766.1 hypothetical protein BP5553_01745 [Venustampulla echinocandica]